MGNAHIRKNIIANQSDPREFRLPKHSEYIASLCLDRHSVYMDEFSSFLSILKVFGPAANIHMANHTYIHTLRLPNGGDIFFEGDNHMIVDLTVGGNSNQTFTIHTKPGCDWENFVATTNIAKDIKVIIKEDINL